MKKKDWIYLIVLLLLLFFGFLYYSFVQSGLSFSPNEFGSAPKCPRPSTLECTSINEGSSVCTESGCRCTCRVWGGQPD